MSFHTIVLQVPQSSGLQIPTARSKAMSTQVQAFEYPLPSSHPGVEEALSTRSMQTTLHRSSSSSSGNLQRERMLRWTLCLPGVALTWPTSPRPSTLHIQITAFLRLSMRHTPQLIRTAIGMAILSANRPTTLQSK